MAANHTKAGDLARLRDCVEKLHRDVLEIKTTLIGIPDSADSGLLGEIKQIKLNGYNLNHRVRRLSQKFWLLVGILAGSGVIGSGLYQLLS